MRTINEKKICIWRLRIVAEMVKGAADDENDDGSLRKLSRQEIV